MWRELMAVITPFLSSATRVSRKMRSLPCALDVMCSVAGLHPFDGPAARLPRGQRAHRHLRVVRDLDAEAAADVEGLHADLVNVDAQVRRQELDRE